MNGNTNFNLFWQVYLLPWHSSLKTRWKMKFFILFSRGPSDRDDVLFDDFWKKSSKRTSSLSRSTTQIANFYEIKISNLRKKCQLLLRLKKTCPYFLQKNKLKFVFPSIKILWAYLLRDLRSFTKTCSECYSKLLTRLRACLE